jgi:hypothetical protein
MKEWLSKIFVDDIEEPYNPDAGCGLVAGILAILLNIAFCFTPYPGNLFFIFWPLVGLGWFVYKLHLDADHYESDIWTEFLFASQTDDCAILVVYLWPMNMLITLCALGPHATFRRSLDNDTFRTMYRGIASRCGHDSAVFAIRDSCESQIKNTLETSERTKEFIHDVSLDARTACACGATVVTLATTSASAGESPKLPSSATNLTMNSYGWITAVYEKPEQGVDTTILRHARLRTKITDTALRSTIFTEIDAADLQFPKANWAKQFFLTTLVSKAVTINIGRMATAPVWVTPPPFLLETVNYPRLPYSVFAYAAEADVRKNGWRVVGDITGKSGLRFDEGGQFDRLEGSMRIERTIGKSFIAALTAQASESFAKASFDFAATPSSWLSLKGALYRTDQESARGHQKTEGAYAYVGVRPLVEFQQLEFHVQADYRDTLGVHDNKPWILESGARLLLDKGKYSVTLDYQSVPGRGNEGDNAIFLRLQARF